MADDGPNDWISPAAPSQAAPAPHQGVDDWISPPAAPAQSTADKYAGWDQPSAPGSIPYVPLKDDPNKIYGSVLPLARDTRTDKLELAVPEMVRAPIRGMVEGGQEIRGQRPVDDPEARSDITAAAGVMGARPAPGEATGYAAARGQPGDVAPTEQSPVRPAAVTARQAGYVLPPASISEKPGMVSNVLAGFSGKIKTQQAASQSNQEVTNGLAAKALGLPPDTTLTPQVFEQVRQTAGQNYQAVKDAIPTITADQPFRDAVAGLGGANSQAHQIFPRITANPGIKDMIQELSSATEHPTDAWMELVKELRFNATSNLKARDNPSQNALGLAQREAANHVDDLMERNIDATGQPGVIDAYQQARRLIAKSYDLQGATNYATGDVNAPGLARLAQKGRPLTDELKTIADTASAFPKAMQPPAGFGHNEAYSGLDFFGGALALAHGNPGLALGMMARLPARMTVLSRPYQNMLTRQTQPAPPGVRLPLGIAGQDRPLMLPSGGIAAQAGEPDRDRSGIAAAAP